eukprot:gene1601-2117_t
MLPLPLDKPLTDAVVEGAGESGTRDDSGVLRCKSPMSPVVMLDRDQSILAFNERVFDWAAPAAALLLLGRPLGFVANLGIIALFGMIIRNSVILVDQIEQDIKGGAAPWDAIVESAFAAVWVTAPSNLSMHSAKKRM